MKTIAITGAGGFVGRALCEAFRDAGWRVLGGVRRPSGDGVFEPFACDLPEVLDEAAFREADACIHAAWTMRYRSRREAVRANAGGTARVLRMCRRHGCRFTFVSSCSAHDGAESLYGRTKLAVENRLDPQRDAIVRPGFVVGNGSVFARMRASLATSRIVPLFDGGDKPLQTVHIDDLCAFVRAIVEREPAGRFVAAEPEGTSLGNFLRELAAHDGLAPLFVSFPSAAALPPVRVLELLRVPLPMSSENLKGMRGLVHQPSAASIRTVGVRLRSWRESLAALP